MAGRPRHQDKDIEKLFASLEEQDWIVTRGKGYFIAKCPPPHARCIKTVKLTPSDPNYLRNLRGWFRRSGCWKEKP